MNGSQDPTGTDWNLCFFLLFLTLLTRVLTEAEVFHQGAKHIHLAQESEKLKENPVHYLDMM